LLPSGSSHAIIQCKPSLKFSCVLPPRERQVVIDDNGSYKPTDAPYECTLKTPTLLLTQILLWWKHPHSADLASNGMCKCFSCKLNEALRRENRSYKGSSNPYYYHWHTVDLEKCEENNLRAAPYAVANTDGTYICWGRNEYPPSLRIANTVYWLSRLNNSPGKFSYDRTSDYLESNKNLAAQMQAYSENYLKGEKPNLNFSNKHKEIFGSEFFVTSQKAAGIFLSFEKELLESYETAVINNGKGVEAIVGFTNYSNGSWIVDTKAGTIKIDADEVAVR